MLKNSSTYEGKKNNQLNIFNTFLLRLINKIFAVVMLICACNLLAEPLVGQLPVPSMSPISFGLGEISTIGESMTIKQSTDKLIVNWDSFDIGSSAKVQFSQPSSSSAVLNRISSTGGVSNIYGHITANGQVYLINPNGILFGNTSVTDVNTLIASTLHLSDDLFKNGILSKTNGDANYSGDANGFILLENGATLSAGIGGKIMLFAPNITNKGLIESEEGQILLAAGQKIYLADSQDRNLRGLLVEVDAGGQVTNIGEIVSKQGNITLAAIAVNQNGLAKATSSLFQNGSIKLQARDTTIIEDLTSTTVARRPTVGGSVVLATGSSTEVIPEYTDIRTVKDSQAVLKSSIYIEGSSINLMSNSSIIAPSGIVNLVATQNPNERTINPTGLVIANSSRIFLDSGSIIDVSGIGSGNIASSRSEEVPEQLSVKSNFVEAELRKVELRDSPLQRDGILYTKKVYVDSRVVGLDGSIGTSVADVSGYISAMEHTVKEVFANGGSVNLLSEGDLILNPTAMIDLSGGRVEYIGGTVARTILIGSNGISYDISKAPKDQIYVSAINESIYEASYTQGKDAGSISLSAPGMILQGELKASRIDNLYRDGKYANPKGGSLQIGQNKIGDNGSEGLENSHVLHSDLVFDVNATSAVSNFETLLTNDQKQTLRLGPNFFAPSGFSNLIYFTDGQISVNSTAVLKVLDGGTIAMTGGGVDVFGSMIARGGSVSLMSKIMPGYNGFQFPDFSNNLTGNVFLGNQTTVDVSGLWVNDFYNPISNNPIILNGGKISISAAGVLNNNGTNLYLSSGSLLNASGGAWLNSSGKLFSGNGGAISLNASGGFMDSEVHSGTLQLNGTLRGDSLSKGGNLSLSSGSVTIGLDALGSSGELLINPEIFQQGGFSEFNIKSYEALTIGKDVTVNPLSKTRVLEKGYELKSSGTDITNFSTLELFQSNGTNKVRNVTNLNLTASTETSGVITMMEGSNIILDPGASLNLNAMRRLIIFGGIFAPSGEIELTLGKIPSPTEIVNYNSSQLIWIGRKSTIDVSGTSDIYMNSFGLLTGSVMNGGQITINALKGSVVSESGATLKMNGTTGYLDTNIGVGFVKSIVASKAGSLSISGRETIFWDASMEAYGGSSLVAGGNLLFSSNKILDSSLNNSINDDTKKYPTAPRTVIFNKRDSSLPDQIKFDTAVGVEYAGQAYLSSNKLTMGGFDRIKIESRDNILFAVDTTLSARGEINLDAPNLLVSDQAKVELNSAFVGLGNSEILRQSSSYIKPPLHNSGSFLVNAQNINFYGAQSLSAEAGAIFNATGDIQLQGVLQPLQSDLTPKGLLDAIGDIRFNSSMIYPSTLSEFTIKSPGSSIFFKSNGSDISLPLSVMGELNVEATNIQQAGIIRAPFGLINLKATNELNLKSGSLTSISSDGIDLPFGETLNRESWVFNFTNRSKTITTLTNKAINLSGDIVTIEAATNGTAAAKLDISGGGNLIAWEFVAGSGGSKDVLADQDTFAILPEMKYSYLTSNTQTYESSTLKPGDTIYLSGGNGLDEGKYLMLPARYALLPGGYSVKPISGTQDIPAQQNILMADKSMLVSGYLMEYGGLASDSGTTRFLVTPGAIVRTQSEYSEILANNFFKTAYSEKNLTDYRLPVDAGQLAISAVNNLVLDGNMMMLGALSGRGAEVDISATKIAISGTNESFNKPGYLNISSAKLNAMNAESLLIGGRRAKVSSGNQLDVIATNIELIGNANLIGNDIILVATDKISTAIDTSISGNGLASNKTDSGGIVIGTNSSGSGDGALLMVSAGSQREISRLGVVNSKGELNLEGNITNAKSVILDATYSNILNGTVGMINGASLTVGAPKISFGSTNGSFNNAVGLLLNEDRLIALGRPSNLLFNSYSTIDFYGTVSIGDTNLDRLSLRGSGINGYDNSINTVTLSAKVVDFANTSAVNFTSHGAMGTGSMNLNAKEIISGSNIFKMAGFNNVTLNAEQYMGQTSGGLDVEGNLDINSKRITSASLSNQTIKASGTLSTTIPTDLLFDLDNSSSFVAPLGGKLTLTANTINHASNIEMPSGLVILKASGIGDSLSLKNGSTISAKGTSKMLGAVAVLADGGGVSLQSTNGNINTERTASIDVSATGGSAAGSLSVKSMGTVNLLGTIKGGAEPGNDVTNPTQGSFEYYASTLISFDDLNSLLELGAFNKSRNIHVIQGDLTVNNTVTAHNFILTTDDGSIELAGSANINASGTKGGIVNLNAGQTRNSGKGNINLASGATINVSATRASIESAGSTGDGGKVTISTSTDSDLSPTVSSSKITMAADSLIDLSGKGLGSDGTLILRAPRIGIASAIESGSGVNLSASISNVNVMGSKAAILIEGNKVYATTSDLSINTNYANTLKTDNSSFLTKASVIKTAIGATSDDRVLVIAGDEIRSNGAITVANDINFQTWTPGALTIRAQTNINVNGSISAGFTNALNSGTLTSGGNWTYRIIAGADLQSADVNTTNNSLNGNFSLAANKIIRTGIGGIEIAAGGNITLGSKESVIYTAGTPDNIDYSGLEFKKSSSLNANVVYPLNGGDITISSKGNIIGFYENASPSDWLFRQGRINQAGNFSANTSWGPVYQYFDQNIGALAGGDVNIIASGDVRNLSAVVSTNGRLFGSSAINGNLIVNGGGDLSLKVRGNLFGGSYFVDKGEALFRVDGGVLADSNNYPIAVALGDANLDIQSKNELNLMGVFNPFLTGISQNNFARGRELSNLSYFSTYSPQSSVTLSSIAGDVQINSSTSPTLNLLFNQSDMLTVSPSILKLTAIDGDVIINSPIAMMPTSAGSLQIATNKSIIFNNGGITMSDMDPASLPSIWNPQNNTVFARETLQKRPYGNIYHSPNLVYRNSNLPIFIYAGLDIIGQPSEFALTLPKRAEIEAGRNILDFSVIGQNNNENDVTKIISGNNIIYSSLMSSDGTSFAKSQSGIYWGGPGSLKVSAGGNINLGNAFGILSQGNLVNPYLRGNGASITILAGVSNIDANAMKENYLSPANMLYLKELRLFIETKKYFLGVNIKDEELFDYFNKLDKSVQNDFIQTVFFNEIKMAGVERNDSDVLTPDNYERGYDAIAKMFTDKIFKGNIDISFSQIKTERGGDLNISAPFGNIVVGLPKIPPSLILAKDLPETNYDDSSSSLGVYTLGGGNINIFARDSVDVAQSRVFTVAGGDILIWSTLGNIDAGKGSKTATSAPPPLVRTDKDGITVTDLSGVISGSGIGTLQTLKDAPSGNVYLIAPSGTVDAGDAGVRSSGNLLVAAQAVANGANMQAGGTSSGVPAPSTANVSFSAPVSADSSNSSKQADKATEAASKSANKSASALPSLITVEVLSLGDETSSTSDPEKDEKKKVKKQQN